MTSSSFQNPFKLPINQLVKLLAFGLFWVLGAVGFEIAIQFENKKEEFYQKVKSLTKQQQAEQKKINTLLDVLSENYLAHPINPSKFLEEFTMGLHEQADQHLIIGQAKLIDRENQHKIEKQQQLSGYESFAISNSGLFAEQDSKAAPALLAITSITPLTPKNSIYLSEDLFSIPAVLDKFSEAIRTNQSQSLLLSNQLSGEIQQLTFKPLYVNSPKQASFEERLQRVRGVVFVLQPLQHHLNVQIQQLFPKSINNPKLISLSAHLNRQEPHSATNTNACPLEELDFKQTFSISDIDEPHHFEVYYHWHGRTLNYVTITIGASLALLAYFFLITLALTIGRYTQNLNQTQTRLLQVLENSLDAVIITDENGFIIDWNPEAEKLFGYSKREVVDHNVARLIFELPEELKSSKPNSLEKEQALTENFEELIKLNKNEERAHRTELNLKDRSGKTISTEVATSILHVGDKIELSLFIKDISFQKQAENAMTQMAYFDSLTQLENRAYFKQSVEHYIHSIACKQFAVFFMDLDGFKQVNDTLGHGVGDELLKVVAKRIQHTLRMEATNNHICRFGGDEFVIMLENVDNEGASKVSMRLLNQIERVIKINNDELEISTSIGIAFYPEHGTDVDTLLRHADTAMYQSKDLGKNTFSIYHDSMEEHLAQRTQIQKHLRNAVKNGEFSLVYQPQINLQTGKVIGVEALIRWNNPVLGFVSPDKFIPIAEESHLILNIGEWVTKTCIDQLAAWKNTRFNSLHIAMNVSSVQFESPHFLGFVNKLMEDAQVQNQLLELEMTERTLMDNAEENIVRFNEIRSSGFGLSVDDFGTGYSSLSYLKKFPLNVLKIDKTFVDGLPFDEDDISISTAILNLAHSLNIKVVAEGVETKEQLEYLQQLQCNLAQGYFISRPLPIEELQEWLQANDGTFVAETEASENV